MSVKITDFHKGLDEIERIDEQIAVMLESENYSNLIDLMKERLQAISQLTRIKEKEELTEAMRLRLDKIFISGNSLQQKVQDKRNKIGERLKARKKVKTQNKKIAY